MQPSVEVRRSTTSVLASVESSALIWLARRMPARVNSDHLTSLALAAMLMAGVAFWFARFSRAALVLVVAALALNWFGDSLDGTLARVRRCQRPRYGFYVDHVVDAIGALFLLGGLAASGFMHPALALALMAAYFLLLVETFLATQALGTFKMSHFGIGPTELRIVLAIGVLALAVHPHAEIFGQRYRIFDVGGAIATCGLLVTVARSVVANTRVLYRAEPITAADGVAR